MFQRQQNAERVRRREHHPEGHRSAGHFGHHRPEHRESGGRHWGEHTEGRGRHHGLAGRGGGRMRRGESRFLLLDVLRDGPKHGYEIIKALGERSGGQYTPSPGTIYPTLQFAEEAGLAHVTQEGDRRVYELTEAGQAELALHAAEIAAFWERFATVVGTAGQRVEMGFLEEELEFLTRTLWNGLRETGADNTEILRRLRQSIERCRNEVRDILSARPEES